MGQIRQLKWSVRIATFAPVCAFNAVFMLWVYAALMRTLAYLASKADTLKYQLMKCFGIWVIFYYVVLIIFAALFILLNMTEAEDSWLTVYKLESISFSAFTVTLIAVMIVFRPNENSPVIAQVNELLDETLTEVDPPKAEIELRDRR